MFALLRRIGGLLVAACSLAVSAAPIVSLHEDWPDLPRILARIQPPRFPDRRFAVGDFGADATGSRDSRAAVQRAIAACHSAGGGRVEIAAGHYLVRGPLHLESGVDLHLAAGSRLDFSGNPEDFLPVEVTRWEGVQIRTFAAMISAHGADRVAITGSGTIDGHARRTFASWVERSADDENRVFAAGAQNWPPQKRDFGSGTYLRPCLIEPYECRDVLIEGVTLLDAPFWVVHPVFCRNVTVRNISVESLTLNNDGCDPDSCQDVLIEGCHFHTGDDGIAIKAGRDADAWRDGRMTENVVIRHCEFRSRINAICIGSEMSAGVRGVFVEDCEVPKADSCIYFKSNRDRGGFIADVRVRNVHIGSARAAVIRFETNYHYYRGGNSPSRFDDFVIADVHCDDASAYGVFAEAAADAPIEEVVIRDVRIDHARAPAFLRNARGIRFEQVRIDDRMLPERPPMTPDSDRRLDISL